MSCHVPFLYYRFYSPKLAVLQFVETHYQNNTGQHTAVQMIAYHQPHFMKRAFNSHSHTLSCEIFFRLTAKQYRYFELAAVSYKTLESLNRAGLEGIKGDIKGKTD